MSQTADHHDCDVYHQEGLPVDSIDWHIDREERITFLRMLKSEQKESRLNSNKAAEWRLRCTRQANIMSELHKLGKLAELLAGPLLNALDKTGTTVLTLERHSRWKETLDGSPLMSYANSVQRGQIFGAKPENWYRVEGSIQSLGHCLCLAIRDLNDPDILQSANALKIGLILQAFRTDQSCDLTCKYVKWIGKACQFVFLRAPVPPFEEFDPILDQNGNIAPFSGKLSWISDIILSGGRRKQPLTMVQARCLAQMGNLPRAVPHPSNRQIRDDVEQTVATFQSEYHPSKTALDKYRAGISAIVDDHGRAVHSTAHVSLVTSGKLEAPRSVGGGSLILVGSTRKYTDVHLTQEILESLENKFDQFGAYLVHPATAVLAKRYLGWDGVGRHQRVYTVNPTIGDILYVEPHEIEKLWETTLNSNRRVPIKLAQLLTLTSSMLIMEIGSYDNEPEVIHGVLTFKTRLNVFRPEKAIRVRAGLSIESGLKCRLTTSASAAFAHLSQLPANYMRDYLSRDPFLRTGFLEADKFWEVLKAYKNKA